MTALKRAATHTAGARERWYLMDELSEAAFLAGQLSVAEGFARNALDGARRWHDWNRGNAIHHGHVRLGLIALERGDLKSARRHLLSAGQAPASPQLCSYGPNCALAQALLVLGERQVVIRFLTAGQRIWTLDRGLLAEWRLAVERGESVELDARHALHRQ